MRFQTSVIVLVGVVIMTFGRVAPVAADEIQPSFLMDREPDDKLQPPQWVLNPGLLPMWKQALARPESELKRQAAEAVTRAHRMGHAMGEMIPDLTSVLKAERVHPAARHAAAHALIVVDSRDSAQLLMEVSRKEGKDLRQLIEPALAEWDFDGIRPEWRQRIASVKTPRRELILAIDGLGRQRDAVALDALLGLAMTVEHPADVRLAAARAAGLIADQGLEPRAEQLLARSRNRILEHLCGGALISRHRSDTAIRMHQALGGDVEPTVAAASLRSLFAIDPKLVLPLAEASLQNPDANVRRVAIETYVALPDTDRVRTLSLRMNDPHPGLRGLVRESFHALSKDAALDATIRQSSVDILAGDDWRGQQQAALLLGALDEKRCAPRLVELLDSPRPEVIVAVAWSLKSLAVPETAEPIAAFTERRTELVPPVTLATDHQLAHLFELLGVFKFAKAVPQMEKYIPKNAPYGEHSRAAAIWALGKIQEGTANERLSKLLMERFMDFKSSPPELYEVRRASLLTLGRLQAREHVPAMKTVLGPTVDNDMMELTIRAVVRQLTGEVLEITTPPPMDRTGWFLEPIPPETANQ